MAESVVLPEVTPPEAPPVTPSTDATSAPSSTKTPERPSWLPEKFKTVEDMAMAYSELEKRLGSGGQQTPKQAETPPQTQTPAPAPTVSIEQVRSAGVDVSALNAEYLETGKLSDASYETLKAKGFDRSTVDGYIKGQEAIARQNAATIFQGVGGEENYKAMLAWAANTLSPEEIVAYDNAVYSGNPAAAKLAADGLFMRYSRVNGMEPKLLQGGVGSSVTDVFQSNAQVIEAVNDPRYQADPAYRQAVKDKLARSNNVF